MQSPRGRELQQFDGSPTTIETDAQQLKDLGAQMEATAESLKEIADSEIHQSKGTTALAEQADEVRGDLAKAAIRYAGTGEALYPYGDALRTAREWYTANAESVRAAEEAYQSAKQEYDSALGAVEGGDTGAASDVVDSQGVMTSAKEERDALWEKFDTVFDEWEDAYDKAADGVAEAMDEADNDDSWWDKVSNFLAVLGWVIVALAVLAIFVVAQPWAAILLGAIAVLSAVHLAGTIYLYANGKKSLSDVIWSGVGLLTCGVGGALMKFGKSALPAMDDIVKLATTTTGPRISNTISQMPGIFSRHGITALTRGDDAARMLSFLDDVAKLGNGIDNTLLSKFGTIFAELPRTAPIQRLGLGNDIASFVVGIGSNFWPSFGRP